MTVLWLLLVPITGLACASLRDAAASDSLRGRVQRYAFWHRPALRLDGFPLAQQNPCHARIDLLYSLPSLLSLPSPPLPPSHPLPPLYAFSNWLLVEAGNYWVNLNNGC